jgi:hypothetical protein
VIDAADRPISRSELVGAALARSQVIGTPIATRVFAICDAIFAQDTRLPILFDQG